MGKYLIMLCCWLWVAVAQAASVAVFPLQELGEGRNDANLPLTRTLIDTLTTNGNEVISQKTVIAFMANHRIRTLGHLESYYIDLVRTELGASFVLVGTVSQRRERPEASLGLTLSLIRTSDARTVWTYVGSVGVSDERRLLAIGEPQSTTDLQPFLLTEVVRDWPWRIINEGQLGGSIRIDLASLEPRHLAPGGVLRARVRLREQWTEERAPRIFFRADDQLYPATLEADGRTYSGTWVAGGNDGNFPVNLVLEWPEYGRTETALLGSYVVDGTPPLLEMELRGAQLLEGRPVFNQRVTIVPRLLLRKPLSRWKLSFYSEGGDPIGDMEGAGDLPGSFIWSGMAAYGRVEDAVFKVAVDIWDKAGNNARAEKFIEINRSIPRIAMTIEGGDDGVYVDLESQGKIPLEFWRMEMWTREGQILAREQGYELPVKIELDLLDSVLDGTTQGFVFVQDILGNQSRRTLQELLPDLGRMEVDAVEEKKELSEKWVDEF